jgi:hypothetical protein
MLCETNGLFDHDIRGIVLAYGAATAVETVVGVAVPRRLKTARRMQRRCWSAIRTVMPAVVDAGISDTSSDATRRSGSCPWARSQTR